jgi:hypothetical protein
MTPTRISTTRALAVCALLAAGGLAAAVIGLPEYLARSAKAMAESCLDVPPDERRCRFVGGPLQMAGAPVFLENFQQAFLPTSAPITFHDASGGVWTAPPQTLTDGATIPAIFAPLVGDRQSRQYLMAAALHDAYCGVGNEGLETWRARPWEEVHRMFYEALLVNGTPPQMAKIMFAAVYLGGPRWDDPARALDQVSEARLVEEMRWCLEWIAREDPSPAEIEAWMRAREAALQAGGSAAPAYAGPGDPRGP